MARDSKYSSLQIFRPKIATGVMKMEGNQLCCSKTVEKYENGNVSPNTRISNNMHQVNIMLAELGLRKLLYFSRKLLLMPKQQVEDLAPFFFCIVIVQ